MKRYAVTATIATNVLCLTAVVYVLTGHSLPRWTLFVLAFAIVGTLGFRFLLSTS
ncbi:MAG: hypothetical protein WAN65_07460 [Candidatus Sulfotelmatobacter sp.]